jgi:hypothetical protein
MEEQTGVYLFTGFLESGKTEYIRKIMQTAEMNTGERTALLVFEEGEEEYDASKMRNVDVHVLQKENMSLYKLILLQKQGRYERIIVEYNGMWMLNDFFDAMPDDWAFCQIAAICDCNTILNFNANMRQLVFDKLQYSDTIVFNRLRAGQDKAAFHKLVRSVSRNNRIFFENEKGEPEIDDTVDPLPFDVNAPIVEISKRDFAYFYRELTENAQSMDGKTVRFLGVIAYDKSLGNDTFIIGRHIMTCCSADTKYCGLVCRHDGSRRFQTGQWIVVTATVKVEQNKLYRGKGPVLYATEFASGEILSGDNALCTFY